MLYVSVPALENESEWRNHPVLSIVGTRQWIDWRKYRHSDINSTAVREAIEAFCSQIAKALRAPMPSPASRVVPAAPARVAVAEAAPRPTAEDEAADIARRSESDAEIAAKGRGRAARRGGPRAGTEARTAGRPVAAVATPVCGVHHKATASLWSAIVPGLLFLVATIAYAGLTYITLEWDERLYFLWFGALDAFSLSAVLGFGAWCYGLSDSRWAGTASLAIFVGVMIVALFMWEATFVWWTDTEHWKTVIRWGGHDILSAVVTLLIAAYVLPHFRDVRIWAIFAALWAGLDLIVMVLPDRGIAISPYVYPLNRGLALAALIYWLQRGEPKARLR